MDNRSNIKWQKVSSLTNWLLNLGTCCHFVYNLLKYIPRYLPTLPLDHATMFITINCSYKIIDHVFLIQSKNRFKTFRNKYFT